MISAKSGFSVESVEYNRELGSVNRDKMLYTGISIKKFNLFTYLLIYLVFVNIFLLIFVGVY